MFYVKDLNNKEFDFSDTPKPDYVQVIERKDLEVLKPVIEKAQELWETLTRDYIRVHGDGGSCVIGAGIEILFIEKKTPKLRKLKEIKILHQPNCCQGSINWEGERLEVVQLYLKNNGIENTRYNSGWMD